MLSEIEELKEQCHQEIKKLKQQVRNARNRLFMRFDAKFFIQQAEVKIEKIQGLLVKLEGLSDQVIPVVNDLKEIIGIKHIDQ